MGQVLTGEAGQNPARQSSMLAGIPKEKVLLQSIKFVAQPCCLISCPINITNQST